MTTSVPRVRSRRRGICWCCNNGLLWGSGVASLPLYPVGTAVGVYLCCAYCCRTAFNCRPGFTSDGERMPSCWWDEAKNAHKAIK